MELGMNIVVYENLFDDQIDELIENKINYIRITPSVYSDAAVVNLQKAAILRNISKPVYFSWGIGAQGITAANWGDYEAAILDAAQWAQDNGISEFQLGNECELFHDETITDAEIRTNLRNIATAVKLIFTRGNVVYSVSAGSYFSLDGWVPEGKGDIDILCINCYIGGVTFNDNWKYNITRAVNTFGQEAYLSEFSLSYVNIDNYSSDESVQADAIYEMIKYIKSSNMKRAYFFYYYGETFGGAKKPDGTYRKLWEVLKRENGFYTGTAGSSIIRGVSNGKYNR